MSILYIYFLQKIVDELAQDTESPHVVLVCKQVDVHGKLVDFLSRVLIQ
jgi:hypothetical protein